MIVCKISDSTQHRLGISTADEAIALLSCERPESFRLRRTAEKAHQETEQKLQEQISKLESANANLLQRISVFETKRLSRLNSHRYR